MEPNDFHRRNRVSRFLVPHFDPKRAVSRVGRYVFNQETVLAVNVALSTQRPLLVTGAPGSGKSSLAPGIAEIISGSVYTYPMRSRSTVADLCYQIEQDRARQDASLRRSAAPRSRSIEPGVLWWAFDPEGARQRGDSSTPVEFLALDRGREASSAQAPAVVLLDGIDRAGDDFLLDLLEILEQGEFLVRDIQLHVRMARAALFLFTSDGERQFPASFTRLCVPLMLPQPTSERLFEIGRSHFPNVPEPRLAEVIHRFIGMRDGRGMTIGVGTYLDIVRAVEALGADANTSMFDEVVRLFISASTSGEVIDMPGVAEAVHLAQAPSLDMPSRSHGFVQRTTQESPASRGRRRASDSVRRVFLCYRRHDSRGIVGRIYDRLASEYGKENIFKDVDSIPFGADFVLHLEREVQKCDVFFAVIGPHWLEGESDGGGRLWNGDDFVRIEIATALRREIPVVPVLVDGAQMPRADQLPDDIKQLTRRHGTPIQHDPYFHADMERLLSRLGP